MLWALAVLALSVQPAHHRSAVVTRDFQRENPCPATSRPYGPCPGYIKDHIIPLCAGGPDAVQNMAWQSLAESKAKDRKERALCASLRKARARPDN